MPADRPG